ncbi:hypothetical protein Tco_1545913, partial [Tanacetum coccineum]
MAKGQPKKKKKAKKDLFTIYFNYDGIFTCSLLKYNQGRMKELNDTNLHDMSYELLKEIALRLVPHGCFEKLYYCQTGVKLNLGLRELRSNQDIGDMLKVGYENGNAIDMYVEHFGYDIMEMAEVDRNEEQNQNSIESSDDDYNSSDCEEIENVDFQTEGDESVVIKDISTSDPFLNKLCSARIMFEGTTEHIQTETPLVDPDENQIDVVNKVKSGVHYLAFDLDIPWDKMQPTLGMRYETPQQLKLALANYGVGNGHQLWYMKYDWREVLVYCGRNVEEGRCAGKNITNQIKQLDEGAYDYLIQRNPNSWSRVFFEMDRRCAAFKNGISKSFNRAILEPRHKPIITMLEEIRLYVMQRLVVMNKIVTNLEDTITPSIRKMLELLKEKQREWIIIPSGFQELEVRKDDQSYGVNLQHK